MAAFLSQYVLEFDGGKAIGKARFQTPHRMCVCENLVLLLDENDFPFTCDRTDLFCAMERTQNFVLSY